MIKANSVMVLSKAKTFINSFTLIISVKVKATKSGDRFRDSYICIIFIRFLVIVFILSSVFPADKKLNCQKLFFLFDEMHQNWAIHSRITVICVFILYVRISMKSLRLLSFITFLLQCSFLSFGNRFTQ